VNTSWYPETSKQHSLPMSCTFKSP